MAFDYRTATEREILAFARTLEGKRLGDLGYGFAAVEGARGRQEVGHAIEAFFGIPRNSRAEADFPEAGIELKVVPLRRTSRGLGSKERTVISMINFEQLVLESWETASVRKKLKILFVFFEHLDGVSKSEFPIRRVSLWAPDEQTDVLIASDWERVRAKIRLGLAHQLSESDGRIMGPCTKGVDSHHLRAQPFSEQKAKSRAFALKPAFTTWLYREPLVREQEQLLGASESADFELQLIDRFARYVGRTVGDVADALGVPRSTSKNYSAAVARRAFGASS